MVTAELSTRDRIDRTALRLFAEKGVDQTTTKDLAAGAGIAEGTLYRHYSGKDEMIWRLFSAHYAALAAELDRLAAREGPLDAKIGAMVHVFCALYDSDPDVFRFLFLVQHGQLARVPADMRTPVRVVRDVIAAGIARGDVPPQDPDLATAMVFGVVTQPAVFKIYGSMKTPLSEHAEAMAAACRRILQV